MGYTVIGTGRSRAFRVLWMLEELGLSYEHLPVPPHAPEVRRVSASGKVPVLLDGSRALRDSTAILTYLADRHGGLTHPAGTLERAAQDAWTFRILDELDALLWTAARHSFVLPEDQRVPAVKESLRTEFARNLERITEDIEGPFVTGDRITVPDIVLCHCGAWAIAAKFPEMPRAFKDYAKGLRAREAYRRAAEKG